LAALFALEPLYREKSSWKSLAGVFAREAQILRDDNAKIAALRELASDEGPRAWLRSPAIAGRRRELAVDDPAILENIDTPGDLRRLTGDPAIRPAAR
ncbi:MAG: hypothetical protein KC420_10795, partial [Myxococcales bacterium]|nr:hypothetical protein [Myxococcales bacterium]